MKNDEEREKIAKEEHFIENGVTRIKNAPFFSYKLLIFSPCLSSLRDWEWEWGNNYLKGEGNDRNIPFSGRNKLTQVPPKEKTLSPIETAAWFTRLGPP